MGQKVVITGAAGFIGRALVQKLEMQGFEVFQILRPKAGHREISPRIFRCDLGDQKVLAERLHSLKADFIIHLAAHAVPGRELKEFQAQITDTVSPAIHVALSAPEETKLVLFFGSCEEYGHNTTPFQEDQIVRPVSPYGWGKISAQMGVSWIARQRNLKHVWLRPFLTFGPGQSSKGFIPSVIGGCLLNSKVPLTPGEQTRDFIYIDDICRMVEKIIEKPGPAVGEILNLCSGQPRRIRDVAEEIGRLTGNARVLGFGEQPYRKDEVMSFFGSRVKFESLYGAVKFTEFSDALCHTIELEKQALARADVSKAG